MECCDCAAAWEFGPGEREWFLEHKMPPPRRCKPCRIERRDARGREETLIGTVTQVRESYGFLTAGAESLYFRFVDVTPDILPLRVGEDVTFKLGSRAEGPRRRAVDVGPVGGR